MRSWKSVMTNIWVIVRGNSTLSIWERSIVREDAGVIGWHQERELYWYIVLQNTSSPVLHAICRVLSYFVWPLCLSRLRESFTWVICNVKLIFPENSFQFDYWIAFRVMNFDWYQPFFHANTEFVTINWEYICIHTFLSSFQNGNGRTIDRYSILLIIKDQLILMRSKNCFRHCLRFCQTSWSQSSWNTRTIV